MNLFNFNKSNAVTFDTSDKENLRILALAGVFQTAYLVKQLSNTGKCEEPLFATMIQSLFKTNAPDVLDVYQGAESLSKGLQELIKLFTHNKQPKDPDIIRYSLSILHLEKKLRNNHAMLELIRKGIERARVQSTHFTLLHENVMANLASIYTDSLSTFRFRIQVLGEPMYLNQSYTMNKIRALLLAGIRSAVLWRQLGGHRWQLFLMRHSMIESSKLWLKTTTIAPKYETETS